MHNKLMDVVLEKLGVSKEELRGFSDYYNKDYSVYGNEVYEDIKVRLVHLENFLNGNWWNNRFYFLWRDYSKYKEIIDIGFSVPYLPIQLANTNKLESIPSLIYVDGSKTSKMLADIILSLLGVNAQFVVGDAQNQTTWNEIKDAISGGQRLFTAFETIEHFEKPDLFWKEIGYFKGDNLMLSLPIGDKIPSHHLVFSDELEVTNYLEKYLDVVDKKVFSSNESKYKIYTAVGIIK